MINNVWGSSSTKYQPFFQHGFISALGILRLLICLFSISPSSFKACVKRALGLGQQVNAACFLVQYPALQGIWGPQTTSYWEVAPAVSIATNTSTIGIHCH